MALIALAELKAFIHMEEDFDDVVLNALIEQVEAEVATYLGQDLEEVSDDIEYYDGDRSNTIILDNGLITDTPTVELDEDGDYSYSRTLTHEEDFIYYDTGIIQLLGYGSYFPKRQKYIKVTYTHGYTDVNLPSDLKLALMKRMSNTYAQSMHIMEIEGSPPYKIFSETGINKVLDRYARLQI